MDNNNTDKIYDNEVAQTSLMEQLEKLQKKQLIYSRLSFIAIAIFVAAFLLLWPSLFGTLKSAKTTLDNTNEAVTLAKDTLVQVNSTLVDVSNMANEGTEGLQEAMGKIEDIDIDGLNSAIEDLQSVIDPLARLFGKK